MTLSCIATTYFLCRSYRTQQFLFNFAYKHFVPTELFVIFLQSKIILFSEITL